MSEYSWANDLLDTVLDPAILKEKLEKAQAEQNQKMSKLILVMMTTHLSSAMIASHRGRYDKHGLDTKAVAEKAMQLAGDILTLVGEEMDKHE